MSPTGRATGTPELPAARAGPVVSWLDAGGEQRRLTLSPGAEQLTIGRRPESAVALPWDPEVSRTHARLEQVGPDWTICDDGLSRNGTWVNGERLDGSRRLVDGDTIRVGRTLLAVSASRHPESLTTAGVEAGDVERPPTVAATVVHLCGELVVQHVGRRLQLPNRQGRLVFAYVMVHAEHRVRRDDLMEVLWPVRPPKNTAFNLNVILTRLRGVLGSAVVTGQATVAIDLGPDPYIDVEAAERAVHEAGRALAAGAPATAVEAAGAAADVLTRPLLPEFDAMDWVIARQHAISGLLVKALEARARAALAIGGSELHVAEAAARELIRSDEFLETGYALLMEALAAGGNEAKALLVFDQLRTMLDRELGVTPSAATQRVFDGIVRAGR